MNFCTPPGPYDQLLAWASELGEGSWRRWREACSYLGLEPSNAARNLSALGHVEFDWIDDRFAVAPPTAAFTRRSSGCLLLTGARRPSLRQQLETLIQEGDGDVDLWPPVPQDDGPETWLLEADLDDAERFCEQVGLRLEIDPGRRIAECIPQASLEACSFPNDPPDPRFPRKWLDPKWDERPMPPDTEGLWLVDSYRRKEAFIRKEGSWYRIPVREYGPYLAYPETPFLRFRSESNELAVDGAAPLPPLLARAAVLQSGRLPRKENYRSIYANVDEELASLIADKLGVTLHS